MNKQQLVFSAALIENPRIQMVEVLQVINKKITGNYPVANLILMHNINRAWDEFPQFTELGLTMNMLKIINYILAADHGTGKAGSVRETDVRISHTTYVPKIPDIDEVINQLDQYREVTTRSDIIKLMLYLMRTQIFLDGNKRTAYIISNMQAMSQLKECFLLAPEDMPEFFTQLIQYYESQDPTPFIEKFESDMYWEDIEV